MSFIYPPAKENDLTTGESVLRVMESEVNLVNV